MRKTAKFLSCLFLLAFFAKANEKWDVGIAWLERSPKYPVPMKAVGESNWPKIGDELTFTAHLYNNSKEGTLPSDLKVKVTWTVNTKIIGETEAAFKDSPFTESSIKWTVPQNYTYDFSKTITNYVEAALAFSNGTEDREAANNKLAVCLDALVFKVKVNKQTFEKYTEKEGLSFFDRMNENLKWMNDRFATAIYPLSPYGIIDRYRVDTVELTDEETEPNLWHGDPEATTRLFFNEGGKVGAFFNAPYYWIGQTFCFVKGAVTNGIFSTMGIGAVTHEAGHSLQLPDTYIFDISEKANEVTHEAIGCDWMDANGLIDIMRYPYSKDSRFTELSAVAANTQAGVFRRQTPEIMNVDGKRLEGWMFRCLPKKVNVRYFSAEGQELPDGLPVSIYRGDRRDYHVMIPKDGLFLKTEYKKGGISFDPEFDKSDKPNIGKNTYLVKLDLPNGKSFTKILDQLRFNYRYIKGEKESQTFAFTNSFATISITSVELHVTKDGSGLVLKIGTNNPEGTLVRYAASPDALKKTSFFPLTDGILLPNNLQEGCHELFLQALSKDGFESSIRKIHFDYDSQLKKIIKR